MLHYQQLIAMNLVDW